MKIRLLMVSALVFGIATNAQAQSILIDNFNQGAGGNTFSHDQTDPGSSSNLHTGLTTTTIGAQRIARVHIPTGTGTANINNTANPGVFSLSLPSSATIQAHFHLYWGYDVYNPAAPTPIDASHDFFDLNVDTTSLANPQVTFTLVRLDNPGIIRATLVSDRTGSAAFRTVTLNRPVNTDPVVINITQADFAAGTGSGTLNWADIDNIILESGDLGDSTDLRLDDVRFTAVPEPAAYALMAGAALLTGAGVWYRRRKNAQGHEATLSVN
jgi:hypothetical protein